MQMVFLVLDDPVHLNDVLDAWHAAGIAGATKVESAGLHRLRARVLGARYAVGFQRLIERVEENHCTLFLIARDAAEAARCLALTEAVVGDLDQPNTGVFAAWDLTLTKGVANWAGPEDAIEGEREP